MVKIDKEKKKFIISQLNAIGLTYQDIGKALGVSRQRVEQLINSHYESLFQYQPKKVKGHNIVTLLLNTQGLSVTKLAKKIGISQNTLYNKIYCFQNGSKLRRKRYFTATQAEMVAKFFGETLEVLFEKVSVPILRKGKLLNTQKT